MFTTARGCRATGFRRSRSRRTGLCGWARSAGVVTLRNGVWRVLRQDAPLVYHPQSIASNGKGTVYIASGEGLLEATWGGDFWKLEPVPGAPPQLARTVYPDGKDVWFTSANALWRLSGGRLTRFSTAEGLPDDEEWGGIARGATGDLYVRSRKSLRVLRKGKTRFTAVKGLPNGNWSDQIGWTPGGNWSSLPTKDCGARMGRCWRERRTACRTTSGLLHHYRQGGPALDRHGEPGFVPLGGRPCLGRVQRTGRPGRPYRGGYSPGPVGSALDRHRRSLDRLIGSKLKIFSKAAWTNQIRAIRSTPDGTIWVATVDNGLAAVNRVTGKVRMMDVAEGFSAQRIVGMDVMDDQLWVYTRQGVFTAEEPQNSHSGRSWHFRHWTSLERFAPETREQSVYRVLRDKQGRLWAATLAGLFMCDQEGKWQRFSWRDKLLEDAVTFLTRTHRDGSGSGTAAISGCRGWFITAAI